MLFSQAVFLFGFLFTVLFIYYVILHGIKLRNIFLFVASIVFYAWGEPKFVLIMLLSIVMNWLFGIFIDKYRDFKSKARLVLVCMLAYNIAIIFVFKYLMFFMENVNALTGMNFTIPVIELPIGISFFTFQAISYVIDVYRNHGRVQKNILNVGLYIAFFPQLVAGPIVRYETIAQEILYRKETFEDFSKGTCRFIAGLVKKVLISNQMAIIADSAFNSDVQISVLFAWLGVAAYTLQIYFDFSGYSDMAIGLGRMFGFHFNENFNYPYISKNITEFWRRWHISLSSWFRDYVYIPLGGSRVSSKGRLLFNLFIVWLLTGVWHGASWNFIAWGLYFFVFLTIEKMFFPNVVKNADQQSMPVKILGHIYAIIVVMFGWVLFRSATLSDAVLYTQTMLGLQNAPLIDTSFLQYINEKQVFLICAVIFSMPICKWINNAIKQYQAKKLRVTMLSTVQNILYPVTYTALFFICVAYLLKGTYNPFIYFNF